MALLEIYACRDRRAWKDEIMMFLLHLLHVIVGFGMYKMLATITGSNINTFLWVFSNKSAIKYIRK